MQSSNIDVSQINPQQVAQLIQGTLSGNNQRIKQSTKLLKAYSKHPTAIRTFSYLLINSEEWPVRQMCTVLLKRNLITLYQNLNEGEKAEFRNVLLTQYIKQSNLKIQKGIGLLIGMLVSVCQFQKWPQLKALLEKALQSSPDSPATLVLLTTLLYHFTPPNQLYDYLINALNTSKNHSLTQEIVKCLIAVAETQSIDTNFAAKVIQIWERSNWSQEISLMCIDFLNIIAEKRIKLSEQIITWICKKIIVNRKMSNKIRSSALDFLQTLSQYQSKFISNKEALLKTVIETVCLTCAQPHRKKSLQQDDDEEHADLIQDIALWLLQTFAVNLKAKKIYPILFDAAVAFINSQNDVDKMTTGYLILSAATQGCADRVKKNLQNPIMNVLIPKGLNHTAPEVRGSAINSLCYFAEHLIPQIIEYHSTIIPSMMNYIGDLSPKVAQKALIALDIFFDNMDGQEITKYLNVLVPKLSEVIINQKSTITMKRASMSAIGGAVYASGLKFEPYVDGLLKICIQILSIPPSPELNAIRAQNITVIGRLSNFFCKKDYANQKLFFDTYIMPNLQKIYNTLVNETDPQVRQGCFTFFYLLANAIGQDFQYIFDKIIVEVLKVCQVKEPQKKKESQFSLDSDSQDQDVLPTTKATEYDQKAAAIHALGELAKACPRKFSDYFQRAYKLLDEHYQFFYEGVRIQVSACYGDLTLGLIKSQTNGVIPKYNNGLPCLNRYPQKLQQFFKAELIPKMLFMMSEQDCSKSASVAIQTLQELIKQIGPVLIDRSLDSIKQVIIRLLEKQNSIQDDSEQEQQSEEDDTDVYIFEPVCDLIPTLAEVLSTGFQATLHQLHPYLMKFLQERDDINDNIQMAGSLSQVFKFVPSYVPSHAQELFLSLRALIDLEDTDLNRNIAYCFSEMFEKNPNAMMPYLADGLIGLKTIFQHKLSSEACKDNAMAALCRITYAIYPTMPYEAILAGLFQRMPFSGDQQQEKSAVAAIIFLSKKNPNLLLPYVNNIKIVFNNDLQNPKKYFLSEQLQSEMKILLQQI